MPAFMTDSLAKSLYRRIQDQPEPRRPTIPALTYGRTFFQGDPVFQQRAEWLTTLGVDVPEGPILVVGAGFGYLMEALKRAGRDSYGIEPGPFFWQRMDTEANPRVASRIVRDWIGSPTDITSLRRLVSQPFSYIIDEDAAPAHTNHELAKYYAHLEQLITTAPLPRGYAHNVGARNHKYRIIHMVTPLEIERGPGDSSQNWKTLTHWKRTARHHVWMDIRNGQLG